VAASLQHRHLDFSVPCHPDGRIVSRVSMSLEDPLLQAFDRHIAAKGYATRSEAIRDLIRACLIREQAIDTPRTYNAAVFAINCLTPYKDTEPQAA
jgi:metal-responsive CopG/Arc/MetJ family transcriptional regulator